MERPELHFYINPLCNETENIDGLYKYRLRLEAYADSLEKQIIKDGIVADALKALNEKESIKMQPPFSSGGDTPTDKLDTSNPPIEKDEETIKKIGDIAHVYNKQVAERLGEQLRKPPLGIAPRKLFLEARFTELKQAILRYSKDDFPVPMEWIEEYNEYIKNKK